MKKVLLTSLLMSFSLMILGQNTVGLISYNPSQAFEGYNLVYPHNQSSVFLLNNCGEIVHEWPDDPDFRPGNIAYLRDDGVLVKGKRHKDENDNSTMAAGGGGATIELRSWDNELLSSFTLNTATERLHHDMAITDRNTILAIVWEFKTAEECLAVGRDTSTLAQNQLWPEKIIELDSNLDSVIWEWNVWDHLIQDVDPSLSNYDTIAMNPWKIDVNYDNHGGHPDWIHANALDYHAMNNQIMISAPYFDEVWIIEHTATSEIAAQSIGGLYGRGGDLLFRWGNPRTYDTGDTTDQKLFFAHDCQWIDDFLPASHPFFDKMAVFNNRVTDSTSTVEVFDPMFDMYEGFFRRQAGQFLPLDVDQTIAHPEPTKMWSTGLSSVQFLPNGNTLITVGRFGYTFEMAPDYEIVWEYVTPIIGGANATQGDTLEINNNLTFRMKRYPADLAIFDGKDLSSKGYIELEADTNFCAQILPVDELMESYGLKIFPNPVSDILTIEWEDSMHPAVEIIDINGQVLEKFPANGGRVYLDVSMWNQGLYFVRIGQRETKTLFISH